MKKILILGGTKYEGKKGLKDLMKSDNYQITVLSRHKIEGVFQFKEVCKFKKLLSQISKSVNMML